MKKLIHFIGLVLLLMTPFSGTSTILADPTLPGEENPEDSTRRIFCFEVAGCWIDGEVCFTDYTSPTTVIICYEIVINP